MQRPCIQRARIVPPEPQQQAARAAIMQLCGGSKCWQLPQAAGTMHLDSAAALLQLATLQVEPHGLGRSAACGSAQRLLPPPRSSMAVPAGARRACWHVLLALALCVSTAHARMHTHAHARSHTHTPCPLACTPLALAVRARR